MDFRIKVYGMTCGHCQKRVADAISSLEGVESVEVDLEAGEARGSFDSEKVSLEDIRGAVREVGYEPEKEESEKEKSVIVALEEIPETTEEEEEEVRAGEEVETGEETEPEKDLEKKAALKAGYKTGPEAVPKEITLRVSGMTCAACAANIERVLKKKEGVKSAAVNLPLEKASVSFEPSRISPEEIEEAIESIGYGVEKDTVTLDLQGMSCSACAANIERVLNKTEGVISASANFPLEKAVVEFDSSRVSVREMIAAVESIGYRASVKVETAEYEDKEREFREAEIRKQRNNLLIAIGLGIPIFFGNMRMMFPFFPSCLPFFRTRLCYSCLQPWSSSFRGGSFSWGPSRVSSTE